MYDELIKSLRLCTSDKRGYGCANDCVYGKKHPLNWWCMDYLLKEAADAIEELSATISKMEIATRWIPVTEQLIHSGWYLVACNEWGGSAVRKAIYDEATRKWLEFPCGGPKNITKFVTHYMPLPEPPEEE